MFTVQERDALRRSIVDRARSDDRVLACALLGSTARGEEDAWSDIDVALRLSEGTELAVVVSDWTAWISALVDVADTLAIPSSGAIYHVFLLSSSLQVDLSFWPYEEFRSTGEPVRLVFGEAGPAESPTNPDPLALVRMGWLYALHARSAIARRRSWQADMMLTEFRNQVIALACVRHGLNPADGRGAHRLPAELSAELAASRAAHLEAAELGRSLDRTLDLYLAEAARHSPEAASGIREAIDAMRP
jgi:predicted nucleotidyltransferase